MHPRLSSVAATILLLASLVLTVRESAVAQSDENADRIAPGDRLIVRVWHEPEWSDSLAVDPEGRIMLPRVGAMSVAGLHRASLADSVRKLFGAYLRDPVVDVFVLRRVAVLGSVKKPNVYYIEPVASLRDVLAQAGGLDEEGDANRIEIVRDGASRKLGRWRDISQRKVPLRSGDDIYVGKKTWLARNPTAAVSTLTLAVSVLLTAFRH